MTSADPIARRSPLAQAAAPAPTFDQALVAAIEALRDERLEEAQDRLDAILARWPDQADALHFKGVLRHAQGRHAEAVALIERAIAAMPGAHGAWNNLGNVLMGAQRFDDAIAAYRRSAELAGDHPDAAGTWNNLGVLHRKQSRLAESEAMIRKAIEIAPNAAEGWYNLSQTLIEQGRVHEGLVANGRAVTLWPRHLVARDQVIRALLLLGDRDRAAALYREWLAEEPDNPVVLHQLAACRGDAPPERASDAYVELVFNSFAQSFDAKLESLNYRAPAAVGMSLTTVLGEPAGDQEIVDLGCGTGLCGPLLRPFAKRLAGCDLSVGMLRKAKQRGVYDVLHKAELVYYLDTQPAHFDVAVSTDTLIYFGDLHALMNAAAKALRPGGWFLFTVEALADDSGQPHQLLASGRYAHARSHLRETVDLAGLELREIRGERLRMEAGKPVEGWLVIARKP